VLSVLLTAGCALFLAALFAVAISLHESEPALDAVHEPERALALVVERTMELRDALTRAPAWERRFYELTMTEGAGELAQAITWYEELARESMQPEVDFRLAMLTAEAGDIAAVRNTVATWPGRGPPFDAYASLLTAAYLDEAVAPATEALRPLADTAPAGWFRTRLAERLAMRAADAAWLDSVRASTAPRLSRLLRRVRVMTIIELALLAGGAAALVLLYTRGSAGAVVAGAEVPPRWSLADGLTVLLRGGAAGALVAVGLLSISSWSADSAWMEALSVPLMNLPIILLAGRRLTPPPAPPLTASLGLVLAPRGWRSLVLATAALVAAGIVLDLVVAVAGEWMELGAHWTEWFDADMAWGPPAMVLAALASAVVFAPIFEEIVFRGLLFGTLRNAVGWPLAAALSAAIFALAHGYGSVGFASVFLSGVLWAYAYEATGSLLPGILAHSMNNIIASAGILWLIRL
jgi:membrane protease YdiL (CAAX protease family)